MDNCQLSVKIKTKAKNNKVKGWQDNLLLIEIKSAPEKNKANKELIKFLSNELKISQTDITIIKGLTQSKKIISINNYSLKQIKEKFKHI